MVDFAGFPIWLNCVVLLVTIPLIAYGADWLVEGAIGIAKKVGVSELVIGLTIVSLGTSAPEMAVSVGSALQGIGDISLSNVIGSNIFNVGLILGGCAAFRAIPVAKPMLLRDGTFLVLAVVVVAGLVGFDLKLDRFDGVVLLLLFISYLVILFRTEREVPDEVEGATDSGLLRSLLVLAVGLVLVIGASHFMVEAAVAAAQDVGVSEWVIGCTIVAAGTSMPEFATSFAGVVKGRFGIAAGAILGSEMMNFLAVLGVASVIKPFAVEEVARLSLIGVIVTAVLLFLFMRSGWRISKKEGQILVAIGVSRWIADIWLSA